MRLKSSLKIRQNLKNLSRIEKFAKKFVYYNENMNNFKRNYLKNYNDSEFTVKTKNAPFFMNFPNISILHQFWQKVVQTAY